MSTFSSESILIRDIRDGVDNTVISGVRVTSLFDLFGWEMFPFIEQQSERNRANKQRWKISAVVHKRFLSMLDISYSAYPSDSRI